MATGGTAFAPGLAWFVHYGLLMSIVICWCQGLMAGFQLARERARDSATELERSEPEELQRSRIREGASALATR